MLGVGLYRVDRLDDPEHPHRTIDNAWVYACLLVTVMCKSGPA